MEPCNAEGLEAADSGASEGNTVLRLVRIRSTRFETNSSDYKKKYLLAAQ